MKNFKKGDKVIVRHSFPTTATQAVVDGDVGYISHWNGAHTSVNSVRFDHLTPHETILFFNTELTLVTGKESELEKLLLWNRVSK